MATRSVVRLLWVTSRQAIVMAMLAIGLLSNCWADPPAQPFKAPAAAEARWSNTPTSYDYMPENGSMEDQSRAAISARARAAEIASHGRYSNAGIYGIAALLLAFAGLITWRRARANA